MGRQATGENPPPPQNPIDFAHLSEQTLGDPQLQHELLSLFSAQSPGLVAQMRALGPTGVQALDDLAHRLKGSARVVGAFRVAAAAEAVECHAPAGSREAPLAALAQALAEAMAAIEAHLQASQAAEFPANLPASSPRRT